MLNRLFFFCFCSALFTESLFATSGSWSNTSGGDWGDPANWTSGNVPDGTDETATFPNLTGTPTVPITLTTISPTIGGATVSFDDYTITSENGNFLTLSNSTGTATIIISGTSASLILSTPITLTSSLTLSQTSSTGATISGVMRGPGGFTKTGSGGHSCTLAAANIYEGGTTVSFGNINATVNNAIPPTGTVSLNSGNPSLSIGGTTQSVGPLQGTNLLSSSVAGASFTTTSSITTSYSGVISGPTSFTLAGSGMLTLSGANTYTGGTTCAGGTLSVDTDGRLGDAAGTLTFNGGALQTTASFPTTRTITFSGAGTFDTNGAGTTLTINTVAGMTGAGALTKIGAGTLLLNTVNGYMGGTTITAGTLQMGVADGLVSTGAVTVDGTFDLNDFSQSIGALSGSGIISLGTATLTTTTSSDTTYSGTITETGALRKEGTGTLTLSNSGSSYSGGTAITAGAISVSAAALGTGGVSIDATGTLQGAGTFTLTNAVSLVAGSTVAVTGSNEMTASGIFSGVGGSLTKTGTGTLIVTAANTYSAGTTVSAGTLQGNTTSLQGTITNNGTLVFDQAANGTYSSALSGTGTLTKQGTATLTLPTGSTNTQGATSITAGKLLVLGALTSPTVTVGVSGTLGGTGTITGNVTCSGTVQPGASIGTITIIGDYIQATGSTLALDISPTASSLLDVTGSITIQSGATISITPEAGIYPTNTLYTVAQGATGVSGRFSTLTFSSPSFTGVLDYTATQVLLLVGIVPFQNIITSGNAHAVASCFDATLLPPDNDFEEVISDLIMLTTPQLEDALDQVQPSILKGLILAAEKDALLSRYSLSQRLEAFASTSYNRQTPRLESWDLWQIGNGDYLEQKSQQGNVGFHSMTETVALGGDYALGKRLLLGFLGSYNHSSVRWQQHRGSGQINGYYFGPYFSWVDPHFFINSSIFGVAQHYDEFRRINFSTIKRTASNDHNGYGTLAHLDFGGIAYAENPITFRPFYGLDYLYLHEQGFQEKGASSLDVKVDSSDYNYIRSELGGRLSVCFAGEDHRWVPDVKLSWVYESRIGGKQYHASFPGGMGCTFTVNGMFPERSLFDFAATLTGFFLKDDLLISFCYEGEFGHRFSDQSGSIQLTFGF